MTVEKMTTAERKVVESLKEQRGWPPSAKADDMLARARDIAATIWNERTAESDECEADKFIRVEMANDMRKGRYDHWAEVQIALAALTSRIEPPVESAERCRRCGHENPSWSAPSPLWNAVVRGGCIDGNPEFGDMLCAGCFMSLAEDRGLANNFRVTAEVVNVPLQITTPSGRIWNDEKRLWELPRTESTEAVARLICAAYIAGATAVHENWQEDRDPDFGEAASDYLASLPAFDAKGADDE